MNLLRWFQPAEADYVTAIQAWAPDKPLRLPPVRPLEARPVGKLTDRLARFQSRVDAHLGALGGE
jgi:hypothetical protein